MTGRLEGKVALVTGASRGIGRATALIFSQEGAKLCINYAKSREDAEEIAEELRKKGSQVIPIRADVSNKQQVSKMVRQVVEEFGKIDILINNAGTVGYADIFSIKEAQLDRMFDVNVKGTIYCSQEVAKQMVKRKYGKIVNIASIAGHGTAFVGTTAYASTKAAVMILTKRLALELGKYGINVNSIAPGFVDTKMARAGRSGKEMEKFSKLMGGKAMLNRIGQPEDIAYGALYLSSDESSFMTGQILTIDGGRMDYLSHSI